MKRIALLLFLLLSIAGAQASVMVEFPCPLDDRPLKLNTGDVRKDPELAAELKPLEATEAYLQGLTETQLTKTFGPAKELGNTYVRPLVGPTGCGVSGMNYTANERNYFLPVDDVGGILVFPLGNGSFVSATALYLKTDEGFIPIKPGFDSKARRSWDARKLARLIETIKAKLKPS